jgi:hypothetical protein
MMSATWKFRTVAGGVIALVLLLIAVPRMVRAQDPYCFEETGYCISGRIREFWEQNGGLYVFGLPKTDLHEEIIEGKPYMVQWFERNRLELHPENDPPYDVLLGRLGAGPVEDAIATGIWSPPPPEPSLAGCLYFEQTGWNVCGDILKTFRAGGLEIDGQPGLSIEENMALFGLPLTPLIKMTIGEQKYHVQWFERARLELHPENDPPYHVLPGLLGNELLEQQSPPSPSDADAPAGGEATFSPSSSRYSGCASVPDAIEAHIRPERCVLSGTTLFVDLSGFSPGETVGFWVTTPDGNVTGTDHPVNIGESGDITDIPIDTAGLPAGRWSIVFEGTTSRHQSIVYFQIL